METFEDLFKSDIDVARVVIGMNSEGNEVAIFVRENGCPQHEKARRKYSKNMEQYRHIPKKSHEVMSRIVAESLLVRWEGVLDGKGEVKATLQNKFNALVKFPKFFYAVLEATQNEDNFREEPVLPDFEEVEEDDEGVEKTEHGKESPTEDTEKNLSES